MQPVSHAIKDYAIRRALESVTDEQDRRAPYARFEYVTVTFSTADTNYDVLHSLTPTDPESLDYSVVRADRACRVYHDQSGTRRAWGTGYIVLRCDTANAVVDLLLTLRSV